MRDIKNNDKNVIIYRYNTPLIINNKEANALITAKEYLKNGKKIYTIELEELKSAKFLS